MQPVLALLLLAAVEEVAPPATAPPAPPAGDAFWVAPAAPSSAPPAGTPFAVLIGLSLGATDQVVRGPNGLFGVDLAGVVAPGDLRAGLATSVGLRRDAGAWSVSALVGRGFHPDGSTGLDLLGELGLQGFWLTDSEGFFSRTTISGGSAALPYLGLRVQSTPRAPSGPGGLVFGLFAQQTLGKKSESYQATFCSFLSQCVTETRVVRYGGLAVGLTVSGAWTGRMRPSADP